MAVNNDIYNPPGSKDEYRQQLVRRKRHPFRQKILDVLRSDWYLPERIVSAAMGALADALAAHGRGDHATAKRSMDAVGEALGALVLYMPLLCHYAMRAEAYEASAIRKRHADGAKSSTRVLQIARRLLSNGVAPRNLVSAVCERIQKPGEARVRQILQTEGLLKKRAANCPSQKHTN